jgi:carbamoyl-phosphate synthase small subunit
MREQRIVGIEGVDTRALTRKIRTMGALKVGITTEPVSDETFLLRVREQPSLSEQTDLVGRVSTANPYQFRQDKNRLPAIHLSRVVVVDYGVKAAILKTLQGLAQHVVVLPAHSTFEAVQSYDPQAVVLSNGPGDPVVLEGPIQLARQLVEAGLPTLGICLGHQILGLACGAQAVKMRFGHHGGNHPVLDKDTQRIAITSQNHSYAIDAASLAETDLTTTHVNLYDGSLEGFRHHLRPVMSLQFHPEAHPGPHDALGLFARFVNLAAVAA